MSEELLQTIPQKIGAYIYYKLGNTTLKQLKEAGLIPRKNYGRLENKKPDGVFLYQGVVKAVVEYKQPSELNSDTAIEKAIKQEIEVAKALGKILIVTDGSKSYWVNALNGDFVIDQNGNQLNAVFNPVLIKNTSTIESLLTLVDASISEDVSAIQDALLIDPTPLAKRLWQTIWVATGKSPVKCLYNVVELFIFRFLSDLKILADDVAFTRIYEKSLDDPAEALDYYARNSRVKIYQLFPPGEDGTTIINGTIFVNEQGEANLSQSLLFARSLDHLQKYSEEFGSLTKIDRQFKTKLYESFLKEEVEALGQYFTPRKIVQTIIRMAGLDEPAFQFAGKRFCDPFCGVGGFPLELLNMNEAMKNSYLPDENGKIKPSFTVHGFDKGFERDDERTVILAKANMLIYLTEIIFANPSRTKEFAKIFNGTFKLFKDNLGTFGHIIDSESEKYDYILSNPPYVTSGTSIIKEEIRQTAKTRNQYPINALGLESLSLEWIVSSLKKGGRAFIVIPDGVLSRVTVGSKRLRDHILSHCFLDAIISLPVRTFFANSKKTYILVITKKTDLTVTQKEPVFTYLVSDIGERLTSVKRDDIDDNDLPELERLFKIFSGAKTESKDLIGSSFPRCKIQDIDHFRESHHWMIDRWWTREEKTELGIVDDIVDVSKDEIESTLDLFAQKISEYDLLVAERTEMEESQEVSLGNGSLFKLFNGKRIRTDDLPGMAGKIPVYSANVYEPFGYIKDSNIDNFTYPSILYGIDGNFNFSLILPGKKFATTDHCGTIQILDDKIDPEYLLYALYAAKTDESFDRAFRASLTNMRKFSVRIPVSPDGTFDLDAQKKLASIYMDSNNVGTELVKLKTKIDHLFEHYLLSGLANTN